MLQVVNNLKACPRFGANGEALTAIVQAKLGGDYTFTEDNSVKTVEFTDAGLERTAAMLSSVPYP